MSEKPSIRWGIIAVGLISSWFVEDLLIERPDAPIKHIIQSIGGRDLKRCDEFAQKYCPNASPKLYDSYEAVYSDPDVDVVYIGTPHAFHKQNMLDAIAAGKNILCEKAFTINAKEAREVFDAAKAKGVYVMEAMWLRFRPLIHRLRKLLFEEKVIGDVYRTFADFAIEIDIESLPQSSRYKDLSLGAGTLLDTGIYSLTWALLTLDPGSPGHSEKPIALGIQSHEDGIEVTTSILLQYPSTGRQGIVTSSSKSNGHPNVFCTIWGTNGLIEVEGPTTSLPLSFTVYPKMEGDPNSGSLQRGEGTKHDFAQIGRGFIYEADSTALDVLAGRKENAIMPWSETLHVLDIMDSIRKQGDTCYPGHDESL
ncbi:hypothetical protein LTR64_001282 [Lithohypha guttulata]|uniref:uncharacterized protein n=1 Tax=Lithohypha guttulata TaxID=1690604 RepID=UPI002DE04C65|nr:hypothetical protein LTR51_003476 [Lithohypha guttulata]